MRALIDADILHYEAAFVGSDKETGEIHSFDYVEAIFLNKIQEILTAVGATSYTLFLTGEGNFRYDVATVKPYKGTRLPDKPFHYNNLKAYILSLPETVLCEGYEADDGMAIAQTKETVICTRDKDLRQVPGLHYGWEIGLQPEFPLQYVDKLGKLTLTTTYTEEGKVKGKNLKGTGLKFFYSQLVSGDPVDNIPGIPGLGIIAAYEALTDALSESELYSAVQGMYEKKYGEEWEERMTEQAYLLWMVRELNPDGSPIMWEYKDGI